MTRQCYLQGAAESIPLINCSFDVVTFAGSLSYTNFDATVAELRRVCRHDALVVPCDFTVLIDDVLQPFGTAAHALDCTYDQHANFSGVSAFSEMLAMHERSR